MKSDIIVRVVEVNSGDSFTADFEDGSEPRRLFLASVKAPSMAKKGETED